jgi:hypothetical protein
MQGIGRGIAVGVVLVAVAGGGLIVGGALADSTRTSADAGPTTTQGTDQAVGATDGAATSETTVGAGWGNGRGGGRHGNGAQQQGRGGPGQGNGAHGGGSTGGARALPPPDPDARLTDAMAEQLRYLVEEEKLAGDVYDLAATRYSVRVFSNIGRSEDRHQADVRALLARYDLDDPTAGAAAGTFEDDALQALYDRLAAQVGKGQDRAVAAGVLIERTDIADLRDLLDEGGLPSDVKVVVERLLAGSQRHLAAFQRQA